MTLENDPQFDDPALKAALKRTCAQEKAPEALAERIRTMIERSSDGARPPLRWQGGRIDRAEEVRRPWWRDLANLAAAAVLLLALGAGMYRLLFHESQPAAAMTPELVSAMVSTHDACCTGQNHHQTIAANIDDFKGMGQVLGRNLGHPVLMADLTTDGWKFDGASICKVGKCKAAHLMYKRGGQTVSVFSFASDCPMSDCGCCESFKGHAVAGFTRGGMVYCMVGACPKGKLTSEELEGLLARHRDSLVAPAALRP